MSPRLDTLKAEATQLRTEILALDGKGQLTEQENADYERAFTRLEEITPELTSAADRKRTMDATAAQLTALGLTGPAEPSTAQTEQEHKRALPTTGEYLVASFGAYAGRRDAADKLRQYDDLLRAPAQQALADNSGLVPTPIIGELVKFVDAERYLVNALGVDPMFGGTSYRPRVTQTTLIGAQASEFTELSTRKMLITKDALTRGTYGGYVEISEQDQEFTDPGVLQIVVEDLAQQYGVITDALVCTNLVAAATNTYEMSGAAGAVSANTSPTSWNSALYGAAGQVYTQSKKLPTHFFCSVDVWVVLGGLVDTTGRPIYPNLNPQNSNGIVDGVTSFQASPGGLKFVCDPNFAANTAIVGAVNRSTVNVFEMIKGTAVGAFKPGTLSTEVGYRGYLGTYFRAEGFVKLVNAL